MRRTRPLLLFVILLILVAVGATYYSQRNRQQQQAPAVPAALPQTLSARASDWRWSQTQGQCTVVEVSARNFRQIREPSVFELEGVDLRLYHKDCKVFDLVKSAKANFDIEHKSLYSEGEVEITMGVPVDGAPKGRLVTIRSSGVTFDSATGRASTDRAAQFTFDRGDGKSVGAAYDPATRELTMRSHVELNWRGNGPKSKPMKVESGELAYQERESRIVLSPWSRLTRDTLTLEAATAFVTLQDGAIHTVETTKARGSDRYPSRQIEYSASELTMQFSEDGDISKIIGSGDARLVALSESARTTMTADRVDLDFDSSSGESVLSKAQALGRAAVESQPVVHAGVPTPDTRVLHSEAILLQMRPGGKEIQAAETHAPATLEFLPNRPGPKRRRMDGDRMWLIYGAANHVQNLRAVNVTTRTETDPAKKMYSTTTSKGLTADFDPKTGEIRRLEQFDNFRYEEGARKAQAQRAVLESPSQVITLEGAARVWDASGSASAQRIVLDQNTGDFTAQGDVSSTRQPDRKGASSAMLSQDEPIQAKAAKMISEDNQTQLVYEGNAVLWQAGNRLQADRIQIDRDQERLLARGHVISQFVDKPKGKTKQPQPPVYTVVQAEEMLYSDENRVAHYKGSVFLRRPNMEVKAREIRAFLRERTADSSLDKAFADGKVEILQQAVDRKRRGAAEHAEYEVADGKVVLEGGEPLLVDSVRGTTRGRKLTYFADNDRLLVDGAEKRPAESHILRK